MKRFRNLFHICPTLANLPPLSELPQRTGILLFLWGHRNCDKPPIGRFRAATCPIEWKPELAAIPLLTDVWTNRIDRHEAFFGYRRTDRP
jgi:hypothetical protein